jgi:hypothetical protein
MARRMGTSPSRTSGPHPGSAHFANTASSRASPELPLRRSADRVRTAGRPLSVQLHVPQDGIMKKSELAHILRAASEVTDDPEILVIGSQAILASFSEDELPSEAIRSIEADVAFLEDPDERKSDAVDGAIGEGSLFHERFGVYGQGVSISTATLRSRRLETRCGAREGLRVRAGASGRPPHPRGRPSGSCRTAPGTRGHQGPSRQVDQPSREPVVGGRSSCLLP